MATPKQGFGFRVNFSQYVHSGNAFYAPKANVGFCCSAFQHPQYEGLQSIKIVLLNRLKVCYASF